ncbi:MAG: hypothetical protein D6820_02345 [Lentisphaerae bacterium]|nr:MAG: hypothetical protein D6820_02345 [Lentisphaerota bacterium]
MTNHGPQILPKTGPTAVVLTLSVLDDWQGKPEGEAQSVLLAITCLQGLINRCSPNKVYLLDFPYRLHWQHPRESGEFGGVHPAQALLDDGLIPFVQETIHPCQDSRYPALELLLRQFGSLVEAVVLIPDCRNVNDPEFGGARAAGINACTFEAALPVTETLWEFVRGLGFELPLLADLRGMDEEDALRWSMRRYLHHPQRNRQIIGFFGDIGTNAPMMIDYFVSTHTFCYFLHSASKHDLEPADDWLRQLCSKDYYPPATVHVGPVEGARVIQRIQRQGHTVVCGFLPNASVTSSIRLDPSSYEPVCASSSSQLPAEGDILLAWETANDGDALDVLSMRMFGELRLDDMAGEFPCSFRVNPYLLDLFPTLYRWYTQLGGRNSHIVASLNDGGASYTEAGQRQWTANYQRLLAAANGSIDAVNFFGVGEFPFLEPLNVSLIITGYMGQPEASRWHLYQNQARTVWCTITGALKEEAIYDAVRKVVAERQEGPLFLLARTKLGPAGAAEYTRSLVREFGDRQFRIMHPIDLALAWRRFHDAHNANATMEVAHDTQCDERR